MRQQIDYTTRHCWTLYTENACGDLLLFSQAEGTYGAGSFDDESGVYLNLLYLRSKENIRSLETVLTKMIMVQPEFFHYLGQSQA